MIDVNLNNNLRNVRPYLGILLVGSMSLGFAFIIYKAVDDLSNTLFAASSVDSMSERDVLSLTNKGVIQYGDTVSFTSSLSGNASDQYINIMCFQNETMVFEKSFEKKESVYLYDEAVSELEWDGRDAMCSATLLERVSVADVTGIHFKDSLGFEVKARGY